MFKKSLAIILSAALFLGIFSGCSTNQTGSASKKGTVKITLFTGKVETVDLMNKLIKKFNAENPGIVVEQQFNKDASNAIKVKFASGDVPDIVTTVTQDYIDQGKYVDLSGESWWSRVQPSVKELCTDVKTGKQYKIAADVTTAGIFYNKKIFSELGLKDATTWDEFVSNLKTIKEKKPDVVPMFVGGKDSWMLGQLIEFMGHGVIKQNLGLIDSKKAFLNNDVSKLNFDTADGPISTFAGRMLELKKDGLLNKDFLTATYDDQVNQFANGKTAVISQGMWALSNILKADNNDSSFIGFCPYPSIEDGTKPVVLSAEDSVYAVTSASKHQAEAKKFLDFLFKPENLKEYCEAIKSPSAFTDVNADWGPIKDQVSAALKNGVNIGFTDTPSGFSGDDAGRMVQDLYAGKYSDTKAFAKAYKDTWDKAWNATNKK